MVPQRIGLWAAKAVAACRGQRFSAASASAGEVATMHYGQDDNLV
jgi:hypothetical protein